MDLVGPIIEILKLIGGPIVRYMKYQINFNGYARDFNDLKEKLRGKQQEVDLELNSQAVYGKIAKHEVNQWLQKVDEITGRDAKDIEDRINKGGCITRVFAPSAKLLREHIQKMVTTYEEGSQLPETLVFDDPSTSPIELLPSKLQGNEDVKAEILAYLMGDEVTKLGVCGMGGVGKTTIMMHVHNELQKKAKFRKVIWVTVSQTVNIYEMQKEIVKGLKEQSLEHQDIALRAAVLSKMLKRPRHRPYLLILDDVWTRFELGDVGIPEPAVTDGCKLVLTTRSRKVVRSMGCKVIKVLAISERDALTLFLDNVGDAVLSSHGVVKENLRPLLEGIVNECCGLPLAIVIVASSLKAVSEPQLWSEALNQLRECKRNVACKDHDADDGAGDAFKILKYSYDSLKVQKIQYCFLSCALYPEDYSISKETIIRYWIDKGFLDEIRTREEMKNEGHCVLKQLEDNCLLELIEDNGESFVRMHDLIRDMAVHITRTNPLSGPLGSYLQDHIEFNELKRKLQHKERDVSSTLLSQLGSGKIAKVEVKKWLEEVKEAIGHVNKSVEDKINEFRGPSHDFSPLIKILKEEIQEMKKIFAEGCQLPETLVSGGVKAEILACLKGEKVTKLGVWGMGGVGKTTIMKQVYNELLKEDKFKKMIWVTVSANFDLYKLQEQIACSLEEPLPMDENTSVRAAMLSMMLEKDKPYLLILDDVWSSFKIEDVGIPKSFVIDGCKLVLITRSQEVARSMDCETIKVNTLSQSEALQLFLDIVGDAVLTDHGAIKGNLESTLMGIVNECDGLPLAIVTVAGSLNKTSDVQLWNLALNNLRDCKRGVASGNDDDPFRILKFSVDRLENPKIQYCFLCCALYPEDHKIRREEIIEYWIDEGFIDEMETRHAMTDEGHDILRKLEDNSLLEFIEDEDEGDCVRMHDLLRDMALHMTSPQFLVEAGKELGELPKNEKWTENVEKVSLMRNRIVEIPSSIPSSKCANLITLLLSHNNLSKIPDSFFEYMPMLKILDLSFNDELSSLPNSISKLVNLTTLLLNSTSLTKVPSLLDLRGLKKLDLGGTKIKELPEGLEMLTNLKYLDFCGNQRYGSCNSLGIEEIPNGILSNLSKLQHLFVDEKRIVLEGEVIGSLLKLEAFRGRFSTVHDLSIFVKCLQDRDGLSRYFLTIGRYQSHVVSDIGENFDKLMAFTGIDIVGENTLLPSVQVLSVEGCNNIKSLNNISAFEDVRDLRKCWIWKCEGMECVLSSWIDPLIQTLEFLYLYGLDRLVALFEVEATVKLLPQPATFSSLKTIHIQQCSKIKKLFPSRLWLRYLQGLEVIVVDSCYLMEEIIGEDEDEDEMLIKISLPKLKWLSLRDLPALKSICSRKAVMLCDSLTEIEVLDCNGLRRFPLYLPLLDNGQPSRPPSLKTIVASPKEWWETLEWDHPNAKDILVEFSFIL